MKMGIKIGIEYFKQRYKMIVFFLICCGIFGAVFALYHLPMGAVCYPMTLCLILAGVFALADGRRLDKKHRELLRLQALPDNLAEQLARYQGREDRDYQELISKLLAREQNLRTAYEGAASDMVDYYTVWVHQIKTPIASMRLTLQGEDNSGARRLSEDLFRIEQYVEMVLAYLRLGSSSTDYIFQEYALDDMIRQTLRKFAGQFIGSGIKLCFTPSGQKVFTDEKWLSFVIEQLLSNAIKYTRSGSIQILWEEPDVLCIRDTGIGIAPEDLPRIFERGYTGYNGRSDKKASGLGLYLCRMVCKALGHEISVESELHKGTAVRLRFSAEQAQR